LFHKILISYVHKGRGGCRGRDLFQRERRRAESASAFQPMQICVHRLSQRTA
jgi:hypothetical protein